MKRTSLYKRAISVLLAISILIGMAPEGIVLAASSTSSAGINTSVTMLKKWKTTGTGL